MEIDPDFVPLLHAANTVELDMAKDLLGGAKIPFIVDTSDRFEALEVLEGSSAQGIQTVCVHKDQLDAAAGVLTDAWGHEVFDKRRAKTS